MTELDSRTAPAATFGSLLKVRKGAVDFIDVPEFGFAVVTGSGDPRRP